LFADGRPQHRIVEIVWIS